VDLPLLSKIVFSVALSSCAQLLLKAGMSRPSVQHGIADGMGWAGAQAIAGSPMVWLGLGLYFAGALVWLLVLARVPVSQAYPFVGLGFVFVMLLGWALQGDVISPARLLGTLLISVGVVLVARS
jgi:drug/metabolite transporter (DMT)-like permease